MPVDKKLISRKITLMNMEDCLKDVPKYLKNIVKSLGL